MNQDYWGEGMDPGMPLTPVPLDEI